MKLHITSLGCAKNTVDSENLLGLLEGAGAEIVEDITLADVALVNTCGFIQPAVEESISVILDLELLKEQGKLKKVAVVGCLVNRYGDELKKELPSVDVWGFGICSVSAADTGVETRENTMELQSSAA